jgi:DNA-binding GntR family transcriptional regulator
VCRMGALTTLDLAGDGLVEPVRNRGFRIVVVDEDALDEISELRQMLEVPAMARVVAPGSCSPTATSISAC